MTMGNKNDRKGPQLVWSNARIRAPVLARRSTGDTPGCAYRGEAGICDNGSQTLRAPRAQPEQPGPAAEIQPLEGASFLPALVWWRRARPWAFEALQGRAQRQAPPQLEKSPVTYIRFKPYFAFSFREGKKGFNFHISRWALERGWFLYFYLLGRRWVRYPGGQWERFRGSIRK
jgi:hypothetical protein